MSDETTTDRDLWEAARTGDDDAFVALYERHSRRITSYCFRRTASSQLAQDLTSMVFLETWRRRDDLRTDEHGSLAPVLFGIANNVVRNSDRARRRHASALALVPPVTHERDHADDVATRLDGERRMRRVVRSLERMSRQDREILTLVAWGGLGERELAAALRLPRGTVKSRLSRARRRLHALTADDPPTDSSPAPPSPLHHPTPQIEVP